MKYILAFVSGLGLMLLAVACGAAASDGDSTPQENPAGFGVQVVKVDGKRYNCVMYDGYREAGISCDFDHPLP